jgi:hypothetical protein
MSVNCNFTFNVKEHSFSDISTQTKIAIFVYLLHIAVAFSKGLFPFNSHVYFWATFIPICYIIPRNYFRSINYGDSLTRGGSRFSDAIAFQLVSQVCVTYLAIVATVGFFKLYSGWEYGNAWEDRLYGQSPFIEEWFLPSFYFYQAWLFLFALLHKEWRKPEFLGHHISLILGGYIAYLPFAQYYTLFGGLAEITNVLLGVIETFQFFGEEYKQKYSLFYKTTLGLFGLFFYLIRIIFWPYQFISITYNATYIETEEPPVPRFVIGYMHAAFVFITGLQFYWAFMIFSKLFLNKKENSKKDN